MPIQAPILRRHAHRRQTPARTSHPAPVPTHGGQ